MTRRLLMLGLLLGSCSLTLTGAESRRPKTQAPNCSTGKGMVTLDWVGAALAGTTAVLVTSSNGAAGAASAFIAAAFMGSAIHGNHVVESCRKATDEYAIANGQRPMFADEDDGPKPPATRRDPDSEPRQLAELPTPVVPQPPRQLQPEPEPEPQLQLEQQPQSSPSLPPHAPAKRVPDPIELWVDFWKEVR